MMIHKYIYICMLSISFFPRCSFTRLARLHERSGLRAKGFKDDKAPRHNSMSKQEQVTSSVESRIE